jgi:hypothetical protein
MKKLLLILSFALMFGCTGNIRAKKYGGTYNVDLPAHKKLVNVTFKDANLWFLVREAKFGEGVETFELIEDSSWGILNGKVIIKENK